MTKITKASIDLGNDTIKAHINEDNLIIPSVIAPSSALASILQVTVKKTNTLNILKIIWMLQFRVQL